MWRYEAVRLILEIDNVYNIACIQIDNLISSVYLYIIELAMPNVVKDKSW